MRQDDSTVHEQAVAREQAKKMARAAAVQRLVGSTLIGIVALIFIFVKDEPYIGFGAAFLAFGLASTDQILKALGK